MSSGFFLLPLSTKRSGFLKSEFSNRPIVADGIYRDNRDNILFKGHNVRGERGIYV